AHNIEGYYKNEGVFAAGEYEKGTDSEQLFVEQVMLGNVNIDDKTKKVTPVSTVALTGFNAFTKVMDPVTSLVTFGNYKSFTQLVTPNLMNARNENIANNVVTAISVSNPEQFATWEKDPKQQIAYEEWKASQPATTNSSLTGKSGATDTSFEAFKVDQYATALEISNKATVGNYRLDAATELFGSDPNWLTRATLNGYNVDDFKGLLNKQEAKVSTDDINAYIQSDPKLKEQVLTQSFIRSVSEKINTERLNEQAQIVASSYIDNLDPTVKASLDADLATKLATDKNTTSVAEYQKQQLTSYLANPDVKFLLGSGGIDVSLEGTLNGTYNIVNASNAYKNIVKTDPLAVMALELNKFENGSLLKGQQILDNPDSTGWDKTRAVVMMTAKPALTAVAVTVPFLRVAQLAGTALTASTRLAIAGEAMGVYMTGSSLQDTAEVCAIGHADMDGWACAKSAGMTMFAASSALSAMQQVNTITQVATASRIEQGIATSLVDRAAIKLSSTVGTTLEKSFATRWLVPKGDTAVAGLASFTNQASTVSLETLSGLTTAERALVQAGQMTQEARVALTTQVLTRQSNAVAQNLATTVYGATPGVAGQMFRNSLGSLVFGSQAIDTCGQTGLNGDCLISASMFLVSFGRLTTETAAVLRPQSAIANPQSSLSRAIVRADQAVNTAQAVAACTLAALKKGTAENCTTSIMMAGMSFGSTAVGEARSQEPTLENPFVVRAQALADAAQLANASRIGLSDITINGQTIRLNGDTRAAVSADIQSRLGQSTSNIGKIIGQTNTIVAQFNKSKPKDADLSTAQRDLAYTGDLWSRMVNPDGTLKSEMIVDGPVDVNGQAPTVPITPEMLESARQAVDIAQRQVSYEQQLLENPRNTSQKISDSVTRLFGREPVLVSNFETAKAAFVEAAKTADTNPVAYEVARQGLERSKTLLERANMTRAQQEYARQLDAKNAEIARIQQQEGLIQLRVDLLENPSLIPEALVRQQEAVTARGNDLATLIADNAPTAVIDNAREALVRAQNALASIDSARVLNDAITNPAERFTVIQNQNVELTPLIASEKAVANEVRVLEQAIVAGNSIQGRVAEFINRTFRGQSTAQRIEQAAKPEARTELVRRIESTQKPLGNHDVTKVVESTKQVTLENGKKVSQFDPATADRSTRQFVTEANARLAKVQEALGFELYRSDSPNAPQDQMGNILKGAIRGDNTMWLTVPGGGGKTETSAVTAAERFHYTGRKQVLVVESESVIKTPDKQETFKKIFDAEGVKYFELTENVSSLTPDQFKQLMDADVILTTNKISYEFISEYGKSGAHPEYQTQFTDNLQRGNGFEFLVDEVATLWKPAMSFQVSGDSTVYAKTTKGQADVAVLKRALGWSIDDATGVISRDPNANGPLVRLQDRALALLDKGAAGLRELFDTNLVKNNGDLIIRQDIRVEAYRDILLEQAAAHPEAKGNIDQILGELRDIDAFTKALSDPAKLQAFEERFNGIREADFANDPLMTEVRDALLENVGVLETLGKVYSDVVGNSYEPVARLGTDSKGLPLETLIIVPKDRNIFEGKQISDGMQNLIYNSVGKELFSHPNIGDNQSIQANVNDVQMSTDAHSITILEVNSYARSSQGTSLEANEIARVWSGAVPDAVTIGAADAVADMMYGSTTYLPDGTVVVVPPKRLLSGIHEVVGVGEAATRLKTRQQAILDGQRGVMGINASDNGASNIEVRNAFLKQYGDADMQLVRNRNDLHQIETITEVGKLENGLQDLVVTRLRVEPKQVNGQMQFVMVTETVARIVDLEGRTVFEQVALAERTVPQEKPPLDLSDLDTLKKFARGETLNADQTQRIAKMRSYGFEPKQGFYTDFYDKGADIGVNPLSYNNESLRVFGDNFTQSSEWNQAMLRARGNEGGTKTVYTDFTPDAELIIIGETRQELSLEQFQVLAETNGKIAIQKQATQTRLQFLNEFMARKVREITSYLPQGEARTQAESMLGGGQKRMNVRIGAVEVDTNVELARQAKIAQETIEQVINMPEIQKLAKGGFLGLGRNVQLADLVGTLTRSGLRSVSGQLPDALDFSRVPKEMQVLGQPSAGLVGEGGFLRVVIGGNEAVKPYTEGKSVLEVVQLMEAHTYIDPNNPLAGNVLTKVVRGLNEVKTSFTATNTPQDATRARQVGMDAIAQAGEIATRVNQGDGMTPAETYTVELARETVREVREAITQLETQRAALPVLTQRIAQPNTVRAGDVIVGKDKSGVQGAQVIKLGTTISWVDEAGNAHEEQLSDSHQIVIIPEGVLRFSTLTDGSVNEIDFGALAISNQPIALQTDTTKSAPEFGKTYDLNRKIAQNEADLKKALGNTTEVALLNALNREDARHVDQVMAGLGLGNLSDAETKDVRDALRAYQEAVARATRQLNSRALAGDADLTVAKQVEKEKAALTRAINTLLMAKASGLKDKNVAKVFSILASANQANVDEQLSQADGGAVDVKAESIKTLTSVVDKLINQYTDGAIAYQKRQIDRLVAREKPNLLVRIVLGIGGGIGNTWTVLTRIPSSYVNSFRRAVLVRIQPANTRPVVVNLTGADAVIAGMQNGNYPELYRAMQVAAQTDNKADSEKLIKAIHADVARRLSAALGVTVDPTSALVATFTTYENVYVTSAQNSVPSETELVLFAETMERRPIVADAGDVAYGHLVEFIEERKLAQADGSTFSELAIFEDVIRPFRTAVFTFLHPTAPNQQQIGAGNVPTAPAPTVPTDLNEQIAKGLGIDISTIDQVSNEWTVALGAITTYLQDIQSATVPRAALTASRVAAAKAVLAFVELYKSTHANVKVTGPIATVDALATLVPNARAQAQPSRFILGAREMYRWTLGVNPLAAFDRSLPRNERIGQALTWATLRIAPLFFPPTAPFAWVQLGFDVVRIPFAISNRLIRYVFDVPTVQDFFQGRWIESTLVNGLIRNPWNKKIIPAPQWVKNVLLNSHGGYMESMFNDWPLGLNRGRDWRFRHMINDTLTSFSPMRILLNSVSVVSSWRMVQITMNMGQRFGAEPNIIAQVYQAAPANYWAGTSRADRILNATPRSNFLLWAGSRFGLQVIAQVGWVFGPPGAMITNTVAAFASNHFWYYDQHRFFHEGGWESIAPLRVVKQILFPWFYGEGNRGTLLWTGQTILLGLLPFPANAISLGVVNIPRFVDWVLDGGFRLPYAPVSQVTNATLVQIASVQPRSITNSYRDMILGLANLPGLAQGCSVCSVFATKQIVPLMNAYDALMERKDYVEAQRQLELIQNRIAFEKARHAKQEASVTLNQTFYDGLDLMLQDARVSFYANRSIAGDQLRTTSAQGFRKAAQEKLSQALVAERTRITYLTVADQEVFGKQDLAAQAAIRDIIAREAKSDEAVNQNQAPLPQKDPTNPTSSITEQTSTTNSVTSLAPIYEKVLLALADIPGRAQGCSRCSVLAQNTLLPMIVLYDKLLADQKYTDAQDQLAKIQQAFTTERSAHERNQASVPLNTAFFDVMEVYYQDARVNLYAARNIAGDQVRLKSALALREESADTLTLTLISERSRTENAAADIAAIFAQQLAIADKFIVDTNKRVPNVRTNESAQPQAEVAQPIVNVPSQPNITIEQVAEAIEKAFVSVQNKLSGDEVGWRSRIVSKLPIIFHGGLSYQVTFDSNDKTNPDHDVVINGKSYKPMDQGGSKYVYDLENGFVLKLDKTLRSFDNMRDINYSLINPDGIAPITAAGYSRDNRLFTVQQKIDIYDPRVVISPTVFKDAYAAWKIASEQGGPQGLEEAQKITLALFKLDTVQEFNELEALVVYATDVLHSSDTEGSSANIGRMPGSKKFVLVDAGTIKPENELAPYFILEGLRIFYPAILANVGPNSSLIAGTQSPSNQSTNVTTRVRAFFARIPEGARGFGSGLREGAGGWWYGNGARRNSAFIAHRVVFYAPIPLVKGWIVLGTDLVHAGVWAVQKMWPPKVTASPAVNDTTGRQVWLGVKEVLWPELSTAQDWGRFMGNRLALWPFVGDVGGIYVLVHDVLLVARDLWVSAAQIFTDGNVSHGVVSVPNSWEASGLSRWGTSRLMVTAFAAIPYPVKPIVMAVWDGGQYIWQAVNPTHYEETLARWGANPVARGFIEVARLPVKGDVLSLQRYRAQRIFMLLPWWWNLGTFGLNDIVRITLVGFGVKQNEAVHASQEVFEKMASVQKAIVDRVLSRSKDYTRKQLLREPLEDVVRATYRFTAEQAQEVDRLYRANGRTHDVFYAALRAQSDGLDVLAQLVKDVGLQRAAEMLLRAESLAPDGKLLPLLIEPELALRFDAFMVYAQAHADESAEDIRSGFIGTFAKERVYRVLQLTQSEYETVLKSGIESNALRNKSFDGDKHGMWDDISGQADGHAGLNFTSVSYLISTSDYLEIAKLGAWQGAIASSKEGEPENTAKKAQRRDDIYVFPIDIPAFYLLRNNMDPAFSWTYYTGNGKTGWILSTGQKLSPTDKGTEPLATVGIDAQWIASQEIQKLSIDAFELEMNNSSLVQDVPIDSSSSRAPASNGNIVVVSGGTQTQSELTKEAVVAIKILGFGEMEDDAPATVTYKQNGQTIAANGTLQLIQGFLNEPSGQLWSVVLSDGRSIEMMGNDVEVLVNQAKQNNQ
ncbi:hypothetical protein KBB12_01065, partial [Candidatus Woesebacteria bacterium]|nr:hypothetical protein [Candidatus Woesebacteria bacterium]